MRGEKRSETDERRGACWEGVSVCVCAGER